MIGQLAVLVVACVGRKEVNILEAESERLGWLVPERIGKGFGILE
jgi:hypothetical protein